MLVVPNRLNVLIRAMLRDELERVCSQLESERSVRFEREQSLQKLISDNAAVNSEVKELQEKLSASMEESISRQKQMNKYVD